MDPKVLAGEIAAIETELEDLNRGIDQMTHRRDLLRDYVESMRALHADLADEVDGVAMHLSRPWLPPPVTLRSGPEGAVERTNGRSRRRAFMADVVREAVEILYSDPGDQPMSAGEIHARLSRRDALTPKQLYVALYKRVAQGKYLQMSDGMFWPRDRPPPLWWNGDAEGSEEIPG